MPGGSVASPGLFAPQHPVPPPAHQQHPPGEMPRTVPVPAVDALAVAEHALTAAVARAVPAVPGLPDLGHAPLHGISRAARHARADSILGTAPGVARPGAWPAARFADTVGMRNRE